MGYEMEFTKLDDMATYRWHCGQCFREATAQRSVIFPDDGLGWIRDPEVGLLCPMCRLEVYGTIRRPETGLRGVVRAVRRWLGL